MALGNGGGGEVAGSFRTGRPVAVQELLLGLQDDDRASPAQLAVGSGNLRSSCKAIPDPRPWWHSPCEKIGETRVAKTQEDMLRVRAGLARRRWGSGQLRPSLAVH